MTKLQYRKEIQCEQSFYDTTFSGWLFGKVSYKQGLYLKCLRWAEWYDTHSGVFNKLFSLWYKYRLHRLSWKLGYQIPLHTCGMGLRIHHWGTLIINGKAKIGTGGVIYPGVVIGQTDDNSIPRIGDNVFIGLGAKVLGGVVVGNNVTIAPNAVVVNPHCHLS